MPILEKCSDSKSMAYFSYIMAVNEPVSSLSQSKRGVTRLIKFRTQSMLNVRYGLSNRCIKGNQLLIDHNLA